MFDQHPNTIIDLSKQLNSIIHINHQYLFLFHQ